jgi:hypothetical protein
MLGVNLHEAYSRRWVACRVSCVTRALITRATLFVASTLVCSVEVASAASQAPLPVHETASLAIPDGLEFQSGKPVIGDAPYVCTPSGFGRKSSCVLREHQF